MGIVVVGLGPGNGRLLTREAWDILSTAQRVYLRTARHPTVADLPARVERVSFDHVYETAVQFDDVYAQIVAELLALGQTDDIIYAVPGHPYMAESTVTALVAAAKLAGVAVRIVDGLSFVEPMLTAVGVDGLDGVQLYDAIALTNYHYPPLNPDAPVLLGQVYSRLLAGELKLVLTAVYPDEHTVQLVHAVGTEAAQVETIPLYQLDHSSQINHLTSLYIPPLPRKGSLMTLAETVATLRSPEGCPWDQEQTPQSLRDGLLGEVAEVLDALDADDPENLCEELGDVFYHLVMQTQMAAENGDFTLTDVVVGIEEKLKRRHPHVWGDWQVADSGEVVRNWEAIKQEEKAGRGETAVSILDQVPQSLPALSRAQAVQTRVRKDAGFDWPDVAGVWEKLAEEVAELQAAASEAEQQAELGDLLFTVVNLARWLGVEAETALREATLRFNGRFRHVEQLVAERGLDWRKLDLAALDALWREAKQIVL
ncbi:MAG: nucleoside triphosphate pyrophosphohydrolase [Chloroflexota bacterium]